MPPPPPAAPSEPAAPAAPPAEAPAPEAPPAEAPKPRRRGPPKPWSDDARRHGKPRYGHTIGGSKRPQGGPPWTEGMGNPVTKETSGDVPTVDAHPKATASSGVPLPPPIPGAVELATERALAAVAAEVAAEAEAEAVPSVSVAELEVKIQLAAPLIRRLEVSLKAVSMRAGSNRETDAQLSHFSPPRPSLYTGGSAPQAAARSGAADGAAAYLRAPTGRGLVRGLLLGCGRAARPAREDGRHGLADAG